MRTLAIGSLLFCGLAALLGYVATTGVGMRTTGFSQAVVDRIPVPPTKTVVPAPEIEIEARPIKALEPAKAPNAAPKPAAVRVVPNHPTAVKVKPTAKPQTLQVSSRQAVALANATVANHSTSEPTAQARSVRTQSLSFTVASQPPAHDASQDMHRDRDAERQWREQTLARWREQEHQQAEASRDNGDERADRSLDGTPADGLYKAEPDKKPKKKRHRFLFIRW